MTRAANRSPAAAPRAEPACEIFWRKLTASGGRRGYPRVHANVPVRFSGTPSGSVDLVSNDLSPGGMQVRCDRKSAARLRPEVKPGAQAPSCALILQLAVDGLALRVFAHGRIVHITLVPGAPPEREVAIGVEFVSFERGCEKVLRRFVEQHMLPSGA